MRVHRGVSCAGSRAKVTWRLTLDDVLAGQYSEWVDALCQILHGDEGVRDVKRSDREVIDIAGGDWDHLEVHARLAWLDFIDQEPPPAPSNR